MKQLVFVLAIIYASTTAAADALISVENKNLRLVGSISSNTAEQFFKIVRDREIEKLIVNSTGGEVVSSMRIGSWLFENAIDIEVEERCWSSCANYLFTAADRKTILPGATVAWHGSLIQEQNIDEKNMLAAIDQAISEAPDDKRAQLETQRDSLLVQFNTYIAEGKKQQKEFFVKIGVDERVCTVGIDQYGAENFYILSVEDMSAFGITNIQAPEHYHTMDLSELKKLTSFTYVEVKN